VRRRGNGIWAMLPRASAAGLALALGFILAVAAGGLGRAGDRDRGGESAALYRLKAHPAAIDLEVSGAAPERGGARRQAVTDVALWLRARPGLPLAGALGRANADARARRSPIFEADLLVVAGGRLLIEARAECSGWVADVSLCRVGCDGGLFALVRGRASADAPLALKIGRIPDPAADAVEEGVRIGACADWDGEPRRLQPRAGLNQVTLRLTIE